jgi:hypothetical protein
MSSRALDASDRRVLITGAIIVLTALLSFVDPDGSWGGIMIVSVLAGAAAVFLGAEPHVSPGLRLPATKGTLLLVLGAAATAAGGVSLLTYLGYVVSNLTDLFELAFVVGVIASIYLLSLGWTAYRDETGVNTAPPAA